MSTLTTHIFNVDNDAILNYLRDNNQKIEPKWYVPNLPLVLVYGAEGNGIEWMTKIPNYKPREIVENMH
jgi:DNA topoisomerase-2